ncbi:GSCFA domain-containing protein [Aquimarina rhabdastrellae]
MKLQTQIPIQAKEPKIDYHSQLTLIGSCFVENVGEKLEYYKFQNLQNPFGILFHPKAIETFLWMVSNEDEYTPEDLFFHNELWHCFDAHSCMSGVDKQQMLERLNGALKTTKAQLTSTTHVIITLGTAWVYRLKALDMLVANCHKIPQNEFTKELLSIKDITDSLNHIVYLIKKLNKAANVIFTVSPVRHIKDGFIENTRSKAHLISAIHEVIAAQPELNYFPSYELMMDELRDYRFYKDDMIHPSSIAVDYIWEKFQESWIAIESYATMKAVATVQRGLQHRPFQENSRQHQQFLHKLEFKKNHLQEKHPHINW